MITSTDIYHLAHRLHALIPERLRRWTGELGDPDESTTGWPTIC